MDRPPEVQNLRLYRGWWGRRGVVSCRPHMVNCFGGSRRASFGGDLNPRPLSRNASAQLCRATLVHFSPCGVSSQLCRQHPAGYSWRPPFGFLCPKELLRRRAVVGCKRSLHGRFSLTRRTSQMIRVAREQHGLPIN